MPASHLVEILLPVRDNDGRPFARDRYDRVVQELTERFGGLTAHVRAPASGLWEEGNGAVSRDDIVIYEVMVEALDPAWWAAYRGTLEARFAQDEIVVRATQIARL